MPDAVCSSPATPLFRDPSTLGSAFARYAVVAASVFIHLASVRTTAHIYICAQPSNAMTEHGSTYKYDAVRSAGLGSLSVLPDAILSLLCFYLDTKSLCCFACCSKLSRIYAYEEPVWQHQAMHGHDGPVQYKVCLQQHYCSTRSSSSGPRVHVACRIQASTTIKLHLVCICNHACQRVES